MLSKDQNEIRANISILGVQITYKSGICNRFSVFESRDITQRGVRLPGCLAHRAKARHESVLSFLASLGLEQSTVSC